MYQPQITPESDHHHCCSVTFAGVISRANSWPRLLSYHFEFNFKMQFKLYIAIRDYGQVFTILWSVLAGLSITWKCLVRVGRAWEEYNSFKARGISVLSRKSTTMHTHLVIEVTDQQIFWAGLKHVHCDF